MRPTGPGVVAVAVPAESLRDPGRWMAEAAELSGALAQREAGPSLLRIASRAA